MRPKLIAGNWKMNKTVDETAALIDQLKPMLKDLPPQVGVVLCPPFTSISVARSSITGTGLKLGAQNVSQNDDGAFTGEISVRMLAASGCEFVIIGHSERRQYFGETDDLINIKVRKVLAGGLIPIVCVGETLQERESGITDSVVTKQVTGVLSGVKSEEMAKVVIAYEPVWAIGTGRNATPEQANDVHRVIRQLVAKLYSSAVAESLVIQYGGSMNAQNAASLLGQADIDGGLIGGASLKADAFSAIISAGGASYRH
jgi:triosephosphate isomerase (TIM)